MHRSVLGVALVAALWASSAGATAAHPFPVLDAALYPSADTGAPPGFPGSAPLLKEQAGTAGQALFLPALGVLGMDRDTVAWRSGSLSGATYRLPADATATLDFGALNVEALGTFTVSLSAVDAAGHASLLGAAQRTFNLPRLLPTTETFTLPTAGAVLPRGDALRLEVRADAVDVLTTLDYGTGTHTALKLAYQLLDSDGDGIPDDADPCPTEADCNGNGTGDGDEAANGTTIHNLYESWYNTTGGVAPPGVPGTPGGAGHPGVPGAPGTPGAPSIPPTPPSPASLGDSGGNGGPGGAPGSPLGTHALSQVEATAGGFTLATGTTITSLALLRRRP